MLNVITGLHGTGVAPSTNSYESIATVTVGSGGSSTVTFSSIPSTYTHLQIRAMGQSNRGGGQDQFTMVINSDTTTNYYQHYLEGVGSGTPGSYGYPRNWICLGDFADGTYSSSAFGIAVCDILDYKNTNKYKVTRSLSGWDTNGQGYVRFDSGLWKSTAAISSLTIGVQDGTLINQYSKFALYGVK